MVNLKLKFAIELTLYMIIVILVFQVLTFVYVKQSKSMLDKIVANMDNKSPIANNANNAMNDSMNSMKNLRDMFDVNQERREFQARQLWGG
jgi:hypothetical protein